MAHLEGPHWEIKAGCRQRERQDLGHMPLLGSVGECFGANAVLYWLIQTKINAALVSPMTGSYLRGTQGKVLGGREDLITGAVGAVISGTFTCL